MKKPKLNNRNRAPQSGSGTSSEGLSRRDLLIRGSAVIAGVALMPQAVKLGSAFADGMTFSKAEHQAREAKVNKRLREQYEREDRQVLADAIKHNEAKLIKDVKTESGMKIKVMQAQTGQNPDIEMWVDEGALNQTTNFLIGAMSLINNKNGKPIDPERISEFQQKARNGQLDNIELTVIMSGTGGFHNPEGDLMGGGATFNGHQYTDIDPRKTLRPLVCLSPDIFRPGEEVMTPKPVVGKYPNDGDTNLEVFTPTAAQYLTTFYTHETSHVLLDAIGGTSVMEDLAWDNPKHDAGELEHAKFVSPLNWYHTAALAGRVEGQPAIPPSFIVPKLL